MTFKESVKKEWPRQDLLNDFMDEVAFELPFEDEEKIIEQKVLEEVGELQ